MNRWIRPWWHRLRTRSRPGQASGDRFGSSAPPAPADASQLAAAPEVPGGPGIPVDIAAHLLLAEQFRALAEQDIQHLARIVIRATGRRGRSAVAQATAELCQQLCQDPGAPQHSLLPGDADYNRRLQQIRDRIDALLQQGVRSGGVVTFDFTARVGSPPTAHQHLWSMCEADGDVAFVVVPAYCVDGQPVSRQVVYTQ
ncbi:hypothetical protein [Mycobacteroides abscessus]|uniref:hypothetical protein n=1 Tax=Mycobacteroides abscessus TaxID=36809 RepID=UPI0009CE6CB0|nr:hypothetical protein [Mycobacteroides abscessus]SKG49213.1 Uncharacterised protein [Mycobacteroides abscessus subsp. massiliense]SKH53255.1 Uncharacterised protein [Mycobacteroides abscessus subsp. massiliense]SKH96258.1 Uncharacterised protein [Mycobacteroides abscessus subsp. massiliense]SKI92543.1 Uncharacterised protein [Mycobacteroides abscessus subsp. massiliense]SKJ45949.1 Uncharacterised protein [Mycobacteroides abscessus subsp. massiliense]